MNDEFEPKRPLNGPMSEEDAFSLDAILRENRQLEETESDGELAGSRHDTVPGKGGAADHASETDYYAEEPTLKRKHKKKRRGCLSSAIWILVIFALAISAAVVILVGAMDYLGMGKELVYGQQTVQVEIEKGTSMTEIGHILKENKIILSETLFKLYTKISHKSDFQYGYHDFKPTMGYSQIVSTLQKPAKAEDMEVTIKDASTVDEIFALLEDKGVCPADDLFAAMDDDYDSPLLDAFTPSDAVHYRLEGFLYPDTYRFYQNDTAHRVLQKMLDNLEEKVTEEMRAAMTASGRSVGEVLTMASVIELESCGYFDEMPNIAAVFYNRMEKWPAGSRKLQSDPTMKYPYGDGAYDTYQIEGLPPGPLCNPTQAAIQAAISPTADFDYYFFVTDRNFKFYYNKTNGEHESTIANLKRRGLWAS